MNNESWPHRVIFALEGDLNAARRAVEVVNASRAV
jgi:hypothetical protein